MIGHFNSHQPTVPADSHRHRLRHTVSPDYKYHLLPSAHLVKMKFSVAAPLVALLTAFILALLTLLAGITPKFMPGAYIGQYEPSPYSYPHVLLFWVSRTAEIY